MKTLIKDEAMLLAQFKRLRKKHKDAIHGVLLNDKAEPTSYPCIMVASLCECDDILSYDITFVYPTDFK